MFSRAPRRLSILCLVLLSLTTAASTRRHDRNDFDYLSAGNFFSSVGRFTGAGTNASGQPLNYSASGTLIAPDWVLTAGHVVDIADALTFTLNNIPIVADAWVHHPQWTGDLTAGYDIALVHLPAPVTSVAPANLYKGALELGRIGTYVGYGKTGTGLTGATAFDGQKRGAQNMVDSWFNSNPRILMSDFDNPSPYAWFDNVTGSRTPLYLEGLLAPGDSGGALFITGDDGKRYVAGVNSFVGASLFDLKADSDYGDFSGATRVTWFVPWIQDTIASYVPAPPAEPVLGSSGGLAAANAQVPEPATLVLLAAVFLPLVRRR